WVVRLAGRPPDRRAPEASEGAPTPNLTRPYLDISTYVKLIPAGPEAPMRARPASGSERTNHQPHRGRDRRGRGDREDPRPHDAAGDAPADRGHAPHRAHHHDRGTDPVGPAP